MMKLLSLKALAAMFMIGATMGLNAAVADDQDPNTKTKVIVLGMIHSDHLTSDRYALPLLRKTIEEIAPDYVLTEIPPDRLANAMAGFTANGVVSEARVMRFPEYKDVLFPMSREFDFKIIPTAGWTTQMARTRQLALDRIANDPARAEDWQAYEDANAVMEEKLKGREDDPFFIHSDEYDAITKEGLTPYATLFAHDLGRGDWESINAAHYTLIEAALNNHQYEGATVLITYGAGHKYWFLEQLRLRDDIVLVDPAPYFKAAMAQ